MLRHRNRRSCGYIAIGKEEEERNGKKRGEREEELPKAFTNVQTGHVRTRKIFLPRGAPIGFGVGKTSSSCPRHYPSDTLEGTIRTARITRSLHTLLIKAPQGAPLSPGRLVDMTFQAWLQPLPTTNAAHRGQPSNDQPNLSPGM